MPLFGAHLSIAGGYHLAARSAQSLGMDTVQLFTKNNNQWLGKPITDDEVNAFKQAIAEANLRFPTAHDCYLINLASADPALYQKSVDAFDLEVERAEKLGLSYLVTHPGTPVDGDEAAGIERIARALDEVHRRRPQAKVMILLETTAGQGRSLGHRFEHLGAILQRVEHPERLGVCLDTCHVFAAGYPLWPAKKYTATFADFDKHIGLSKLKVLHVNDSAKAFGSRVDRHAHLGDGHIGLGAFWLLVNDPRLAELPMILETPKENDADEPMDPVNLRTLRDLVGRARAPRQKARVLK